MNALSYAHKHVYLWQSSPVSGAFDETRYPFVIEPLLSLDDIRIKTTVVYGPTQSFKTVFLQIATAYRLDVKRKSLLAVSQTDDDAREFATIKLTPALTRWGHLQGTLRNDRYAASLSRWLWAEHELIISGPGENAQQSKSVCYVHTDEAHTWNIAYPGAMAALDDRMGGRWDRHALHATTAADAGTEVDILYRSGGQNEWHLRCPKCNGLFQPLWTESSRDTYNGHEIFIFTESQSINETLDSIRMVCPFCDAVFQDLPRVRAEMDDGADYVAMNPDHDIQLESFRWNAFAARWKKWRDLLAIYLRAVEKAKIGDLKPYENWVKKQEVRTWTGDFPMLSNAGGSRNYSLGEIEQTDGNLRVCSFDLQEGLAGEGFHLWGLCEEWDADGLKSRRLAYNKLASYDDARAFQLQYGVRDEHTVADFGDRDREVFSVCEKYRWTALKSGDEEQFAHQILDRQSGRVTTVYLPYSTHRMELVSGRLDRRIEVIFRGGKRVIPPGFCRSMLWSKPVIYQMLYNLKGGLVKGREYAIARDMPEEYESQLNSYIPSLEIDKKTNVARKIVWKKIRKHDHAFICSCQSLIVAISAGYYSMNEASTTESIS